MVTLAYYSTRHASFERWVRCTAYQKKTTAQSFSGLKPAFHRVFKTYNSFDGLLHKPLLDPGLFFNKKGIYPHTATRIIRV
jgi:hypothetical protein